MQGNDPWWAAACAEPEHVPVCANMFLTAWFAVLLFIGALIVVLVLAFGNVNSGGDAGAALDGCSTTEELNFRITMSFPLLLWTG